MASNESTDEVNFTCKRCDQPVRLQEEYGHLSELTVAELSLPVHPASEVEFDGVKVDKIVRPLKVGESNEKKDNGKTQGFTVVGDPSENQKLSPLKITTKLFDILSSNSDIDHPLCEECTDYLLTVVEEYLVRSEKQTGLYEKLFHDESDISKNDAKELEEELKLLKEEEARLLEELSEVECEQTTAQAVLVQCQEEKRRLEEEDENYWREFCTYRCQVIAFEDENRSLKSRISYMQHHLDRLRQTNVFNATFHIWYSGYFGTINNLRLGRLPTAPVAWPEINAAWGQTVLLLASLARKIGFKFSKYRLVPHGNTSYVEVLGENKELPIYGSGGLRFMWDHKFDAGMAAFLECALEFQQFIENNGLQDAKDAKRKFTFPYRVKKHYLEDPSGQPYSIKMQFNSEEQWTKALKFLLTNLKWALTLVSSPKFPTAELT